MGVVALLRFTLHIVILEFHPRATPYPYYCIQHCSIETRDGSFSYCIGPWLCVSFCCSNIPLALNPKTNSTCPKQSAVDLQNLSLRLSSQSFCFFMKTPVRILLCNLECSVKRHLYTDDIKLTLNILKLKKATGWTGKNSEKENNEGIVHGWIKKHS